MRYLKIYIEKIYGLYTYSTSDKDLSIGERVKVDFTGKKMIGIVVEEVPKPTEFKVKEIEERLKGEIKFSPSFINLLIWLEKYYVSTFDLAYKVAVPESLKVSYEYRYIIKDINLVPKDTELYSYLEDKISVSEKRLRAIFGKNIFMEYLKDKRLIKFGENYIYNFENRIYDELDRYFERKVKLSKTTLDKKFDKKEIKKAIKSFGIYLEKTPKCLMINNLEERELKIGDSDIKLNDEQQKVSDKIIKSNRSRFLIKGVTGSGKTEVYISLIRDGLKKGKGSIFLVPEISLTPQMVIRFKREFGDEIAILHSKMSSQERKEEWLNIYFGRKKVVLGVRSAIFAPLDNLEYIIVDEEHENSYKQETILRYNAKYVALKRGELQKGKVVFGSATPSIENYYYAKQGIFELEELNNRYNNSNLPEIEIVDMKEENDKYFSEVLQENISEALRNKEQIMLLQNRKGYSTMIQCKECGYIEECTHCSVKMSYYASQGILKCNHCGIVKKFNGKCEKCGSDNLEYSGRGIELIEEELEKKFPTTIIRVDGERATEKGFYEKMYEDFSNQKQNIMIGTQMISRGLHFPNVTVVGVINSDLVMNIPDFRSGERTYQLLTQVAGRAGRGEKSGKVYIQTYQPDNYIVKRIQDGDYDKFFEEEIEKREILFYPPFSKLINIGITSEKEVGLEKKCDEILELIKYDGVEIYGPMKALVYKVKGRYRYNILIKGDRNNIEGFKENLRKKADTLKKIKCRIVIDVDPVTLI